ncbi:unnamed protein product [Tilletia controversa]|nr:unnamed protein product [Tilletia controversa]
MSASGGAADRPRVFYDGSDSDQSWIDDEEGPDFDDDDQDDLELDDGDLELSEDEIADLEADREWDDDSDDESYFDDNDDAASCASDPDVPAKLLQQDLPASTIAELDTTKPIKSLLTDIADLFKTSSMPLREGVFFAVEVIEATSGNRFLKRITELWIKIALTFWRQVAQRERATGQRDLPGTTVNIVLQYIALQFRGHPLIKMPEIVRQEVKMRPHREQIRREFRARSRSMYIITHRAQELLGLGTLGRLHQSTLDPRLPKRPKTIVLESTIDGLAELLNLALSSSADTPDDTALHIPRLEAFFQMGLFLRNLHAPQISHSDLKRKQSQPNNSDLDADGNDGDNLDQAGPASVDPTATTPARVSASNQAASEVIDDLSPSHLAFEDLNNLKQWKVRAASRFRALVHISTLRADAIQSSFSETATVLMVCSTLLYQRDAPSLVIPLAQVFVATVREEYEQDPSIANRLRLCNSLGVLFLIFSQAAHNFDAMRAGEEAIACLQPLCEDNPSEHLPLMASLKMAYCDSLISTADSDETTYGSLNRVGVLRKSSRVATQAVDLARSIVEAKPTELKARWTLAYALFLKGRACCELRDACAALTIRYANYNLETVSPKLFAKVDDRSYENVDSALAASEECISIYRRLAEDSPKLFDPLLAKALHSAADAYGYHPQLKSEQAIAYYREAITILLRLSQSFPSIFEVSLGRSYFSLAHQLNSDSRLVEAEESFDEMLKVCPRRNKLVGQVWQYRAVLCFRLERYQEALAHATKSDTIFQSGDDPSESRVGALAVQGFCIWVLDAGRAEEALDILKWCISNSLCDGCQFRRPSQIRYVSDDQYMFCLALGWNGAVRCALGQRTDARANGERALMVTRALLKSRKNMSSTTRRTLEPSHHVLPHLLVLLAGTHLEAGRYDMAKKAVDESLKLGEAADGPTRKTALLLKARLLDKDGLEAEAAATRAEADKIHFKGFLDALGC